MFVIRIQGKIRQLQKNKVSKCFTGNSRKYFLKIKKRESGAQRRVRKKARKKARKRARYQWTILESLKNFLLHGEQRI